MYSLINVTLTNLNLKVKLLVIPQFKMVAVLTREVT